MIAATGRQRDVLKAISAYQHQHGFPVSIRELGDILGIRSTNGVNEHIERLTKKGLVRREPMRARTLQLTNAGHREIIHG